MKIVPHARAIALGFVFGACTVDTPVPTGGGGASGAGGQSCVNVTACGGDVVGTWTVNAACLKVSGELDLASLGVSCPSTPVTGSMQVTGTWTANKDGTYTDATTTSGDVTFNLAQACLVISSTPVMCDGAGSLLGAALGYSSLNCTSMAGGGCACSGTIHQTGSMGAASSSPTTSGNYTVANNELSLTRDSGDAAVYPYCVSGATLTMTPRSKTPTVTGSIALHKGDSIGSGGSAGSSGGGVGTAGSGSGGGITGSGGVVGAAGAVAQGGAAGQAGTNGVAGSGGAGGGAPGTGMGPCDIYKAGGNPCVAAHSTVRALFSAYGGKLYQVRNTAGTTKDILALTPGGFADGPSQDAFCAGTACVITVLYDQSGKGNDLWYQGSTMVAASTSSAPAKATSESLTLSGHKAYSLYINPNNSYWVDSSKSGVPLGAEPEAMYMVTNSKHYNGGCCFDYGNSEVDRKADGSGAMDALNFSSITAWGTGAGSGPWVMADLEYGVFAQNNTMKNQNDPSQTATYVTAILKNNGTSEFALRGGDASAGKLSTYYKGPLPGGWSPMKKQGAIVLGSGGDCCKPGGGANASDGTFYEGCIVTGYPSDATEDAIQANIVAAGYGK